MIDLGQYDAMKSPPCSAAEQQGVFDRFRIRQKALNAFQRWEEETYGDKTPLAEMHADLWVQGYMQGHGDNSTDKKSDSDRMALASYLVDYIFEEQSRGNACIDKWMISDAIEAWQGGAR